MPLGIKSNHYSKQLVCPFLGLVYSKFLWLGGCPELARLRALRFASARRPVSECVWLGKVVLALKECLLSEGPSSLHGTLGPGIAGFSSV